MLKICSKCKEEKELLEFGKNKSSKDGYRSECKECRKQNRKRKTYSPIIVSENDLKICSACKEEKTYSHFSKYKYSKDGFKNKCKECLKKEKQENPEKTKEYNLNYKKSKIEFINNQANNLFQEKKKMTYIIKSDNFYKIGSSNNLGSRIFKLNQEIEIQELYVLNSNIEIRLFKELKNYRFTSEKCFNGMTECFNFDNSILEFILNNNDFKKLNLS